MALIVEDGTGLSNADAYISVADALAYHDARGNTNWADITATEQEQAIRRATDFMEQLYRLSWKGRRTTEAQALSWPRYDVLRDDGYYYYASDIVPTEVKNACAELAFKAAGGDLSPDLAQRVIREKIGPLEVEYEKNGVQYTTYRAINNMLAPFLTGLGGAFKKVIRT
ncbi:MAG: DnaT-like ssDNA-binding protein [Pseudomonadota bacterium]